jgi:ubiquinol-cytochrome c reductase iron-sulfur subunit
MLASLKTVEERLSDPGSDKSNQPAYAKTPTRAVNEEYLVAIGICTHLGCSPSEKLKAGNVEGMAADWPGGFLCPCHGSLFDLAGRVFSGQPAPTNLEIPPHMFDDTANPKVVTIGVDPTNTKGA